jgi:hypothetical protein
MYSGRPIKDNVNIEQGNVRRQTEICKPLEGAEECETVQMTLEFYLH